MERSYTLEALKRTAGYEYEGVQTHLPAVSGMMRFANGDNSNFTFSEFNWLDIQFLIRTETKYTIFPNLNGHVGAIYSGFKKNKQGYYLFNASKGGLLADKKCQKTKWKNSKSQNPIFKKGFNSRVEELFNRSHSISVFMIELLNFYQNYILHDRTVKYTPTKEACYFSNGDLTSEPSHIEFFKKEKLKKPREIMEIWFRDFIIQHSIANSQPNQTLQFSFTNEILPQSPPNIYLCSLSEIFQELFGDFIHHHTDTNETYVSHVNFT